MKCPNCNVNLLMTDRHGVEIDYCPQCRGVWLDRGELDKIIERSAGADEAQRRCALPATIRAMIRANITGARSASHFWATCLIFSFCTPSLLLIALWF